MATYYHVLTNILLVFHFKFEKNLALNIYNVFFYFKVFFPDHIPQRIMPPHYRLQRIMIIIIPSKIVCDGCWDVVIYIMHV